MLCNLKSAGAFSRTTLANHQGRITTRLRTFGHGGRGELAKVSIHNAITLYALLLLHSGHTHTQPKNSTRVRDQQHDAFTVTIGTSAADARGVTSRADAEASAVNENTSLAERDTSRDTQNDLNAHLLPHSWICNLQDACTQ